MSTENKSGLADYASIRYLEPKSSSFEQTPGGFLSLKIEPDEFYARVNLHRAFPFSQEEKYISVRDPEGKEIGIIRSMKDFPSSTVKLFQLELERRYFTPIIQKISSIKEEFGYSYWDVETDSGHKRFTVRRGSSSIIPITDERLIIIDVDGNRFEIPNYKSLGNKNIKIIETLL
jgi:hypothetical protein